MSSNAHLCVLYARVSSKEQSEEGYSIPAQLKIMRDYCEKKGLTVLKEFTEVESAKTTKRKAYYEMLKFISELRAKSNLDVAIVVEKQDRLTRNFKDYTLIEELKVTVHFIKDGTVFAPDATAQQKLNQELQVVIHKHYIDNLGQEAKKGMKEKAESGWYPSRAPLGYINVTEGREKVIKLDHSNCHLVRTLFEEFATGKHSILSITKFAKQIGLRAVNKGTLISKSQIYRVLTNPFYYGEFEWHGQTIKGLHEPLFSRSLFDAVQNVLKKNGQGRVKTFRHEFAFTGLVRCGCCGSAFTAEVKKGRYRYYHCARSKSECEGRTNFSEEKIEEMLKEALRAVQLNEKLAEWLKNSLKESTANIVAEQEKILAAIEAEERRLQQKRARAYEDRLEGVITVDQYKQISDQVEQSLRECAGRREGLQQADRKNIELGLNLIELSQRAEKIYEKAESLKKREILNFVISNSIFKDGKLTFEFRKPYDLLVLAKQRAALEANPESAKNDESEIWRPLGNSNPRLLRERELS